MLSQLQNLQVLSLRNNRASTPVVLTLPCLRALYLQATCCRAPSRQGSPRGCSPSSKQIASSSSCAATSSIGHGDLSRMGESYHLWIWGRNRAEEVKLTVGPTQI